MKSNTVEMIVQEPSYTMADLGGEISRNSVDLLCSLWYDVCF